MSEELSQAEIIERLDIGLRRMPKMQREIFLALRLDNLTYKEIAECTGLSIKQVERHIARSMLTLLDAVDRRAPVPWWKRLILSSEQRSALEHVTAAMDLGVVIGYA